jgi:hypothetical protein
VSQNLAIFRSSPGWNPRELALSSYPLYKPRVIFKLVDNQDAGTILTKRHMGLATCDGCGKTRRDVKSCGQDSNGEPDAPDLCFLCRTEWSRSNRVYDRRIQAYVTQTCEDE